MTTALIAVALLSIACATPARVQDSAPATGVVHERMPAEVGAYVVAISDTTRLDLAGQRVLESRVVAPVRLRNGSVAVDTQFPYLIGGKFVKVRATMPEQEWEQSNLPSFARELARRLATGAGTEGS